jgi:hypothetical protein
MESNLSEPLLLDIHRTLGYLLGLHAHWLTSLSQSHSSYQHFQSWFSLLRAGIDIDINNNYVNKIINNKCILLNTYFYLLFFL